jgi:hypothetical protein
MRKSKRPFSPWDARHLPPSKYQRINSPRPTNNSRRQTIDLTLSDDEDQVTKYSPSHSLGSLTKRGNITEPKSVLFRDTVYNPRTQQWDIGKRVEEVAVQHRRDQDKTPQLFLESDRASERGRNEGRRHNTAAQKTQGGPVLPRRDTRLNGVPPISSGKKSARLVPSKVAVPCTQTSTDKIPPRRKGPFDLSEESDAEDSVPGLSASVQPASPVSQHNIDENTTHRNNRLPTSKPQPLPYEAIRVTTRQLDPDVRQRLTPDYEQQRGKATAVPPEQQASDGGFHPLNGPTANTSRSVKQSRRLTIDDYEDDDAVPVVSTPTEAAKRSNQNGLVSSADTTQAPPTTFSTSNAMIPSWNWSKAQTVGARMASGAAQHLADIPAASAKPSKKGKYFSLIAKIEAARARNKQATLLQSKIGEQVHASVSAIAIHSGPESSDGGDSEMDIDKPLPASLEATKPAEPKHLHYISGEHLIQQKDQAAGVDKVPETWAPDSLAQRSGSNSLSRVSSTTRAFKEVEQTERKDVENKHQQNQNKAKSKANIADERVIKRDATAASQRNQSRPCLPAAPQGNVRREQDVPANPFASAMASVLGESPPQHSVIPSVPVAVMRPPAPLPLSRVLNDVARSDTGSVADSDEDVCAEKQREKQLKEELARKEKAIAAEKDRMERLAASQKRQAELQEQLRVRQEEERELERKKAEERKKVLKAQAQAASIAEATPVSPKPSIIDPPAAPSTTAQSTTYKGTAAAPKGKGASCPTEISSDVKFRRPSKPEQPKRGFWDGKLVGLSAKEMKIVARAEIEARKAEEVCTGD